MAKYFSSGKNFINAPVVKYIYQQNLYVSTKYSNSWNIYISNTFWLWDQTLAKYFSSVGLYVLRMLSRTACARHILSLVSYISLLITGLWKIDDHHRNDNDNHKDHLQKTCENLQTYNMSLLRNEDVLFFLYVSYPLLWLSVHH